MSVGKRICLIGLQRCGSQYISELIEKNNSNLCLVEPFTFKHDVSLKEFNHNFPESAIQNIYETPLKQAEAVIDGIKKIDKDIPLVLKLFLVNEGKETYCKIIAALKELNFEFFIIKRENMLDHYLSYLIAQATDKWTNRTLNYDNKHVIIPIKNLSKFDWFFFKIKKFDEIISMPELGLSGYPVVRYEHAVSDLSKLFGFEFTSDSIKIRRMSELPNHQRIVNFDEIKQHWDYLSIATDKKTIFI